MNQTAGLDLRKTGLVVLSGCQSQSGRLTQGDDIVGLSRAFMHAGSPSVIASLWSIDDEGKPRPDDCSLFSFEAGLATGGCTALGPNGCAA